MVLGESGGAETSKLLPVAESVTVLVFVYPGDRRRHLISPLRGGKMLKPVVKLVVIYVV